MSELDAIYQGFLQGSFSVAVAAFEALRQWGFPGLEQASGYFG